MPLLPILAFFALMAALQAADGWTTYTLHKLAAESRRFKFREMNPLLRKVMAWIGVEEALWIAKLAAMAWLWFHPVLLARDQWLLIAVYVLIVANNYRQVKKLKRAQP